MQAKEGGGGKGGEGKEGGGEGERRGTEKKGGGEGGGGKKDITGVDLKRERSGLLNAGPRRNLKFRAYRRWGPPDEGKV